MESSKTASIAATPGSKPEETVDSFVDTNESKKVTNVVGTPERLTPIRTGSSTKAFTRANPDDPVSADSFTSYRLDEPVKLQMSDTGVLAQKPITVMTALQMTADRYHDQDAFAVQVDGKWQKTKLRDMCRTVRIVAKGFLRLGLVKLHGVGIMGYNSPEWIISCLAAINAGGVAVGIHYKYPIEECKRVALMAQCNIIVVDSSDDLDKILQIRSDLPDLIAIVQYGKNEAAHKTHGIFTWEKLLVMGEKAPEDKLKERILSMAPNYCCTLTFTMGRSGPKKPVMLSHDNAIWQATVFGKYKSFSKYGGAHISFHPLSQPIGMLVDIFIPLVYATTVYFVPRKYIKTQLVEMLSEVRPTFLATVPFFFEKIADQIKLSIENRSTIRKMIVNWSMKIGQKAYRNSMEGKPRPFGWWLANQLVFKQFQRKLGLDRCLDVHAVGNLLLARTAEFFTGLNMLILAAWGNTETTGPHVVSSPDRHRLGSCGVEMDGCSTKFVPVDKTVYTELRVKGRNVFMGYLNEPQMTADAFDEDGWHKTGDLGYRDESGFIWIVGSLYELYTMSDGRIIAPIVIEEDIKNLLPFIGHCFAYGRNRPYLVMLFTLEAATDEVTEVPLDVLSKRAEMFLRKMNVEISAISKMVTNPPENLVSIIQSAIDVVNASNSKDPATTIRKWRFLPRDFSVPTGEMTVSFREKRNYIIELYASTLDSMYATD